MDSRGSRPLSLKTAQVLLARQMLSMAHRFTELVDLRSQMLVESERLKSKMLALHDENVRLKLALTETKRKLELARTLLERGAGPRDVSPEPRSDLQPPPRQTAESSRAPSLSDAQGDAARGSLLPHIHRGSLDGPGKSCSYLNDVD